MRKIVMIFVTVLIACATAFGQGKTKTQTTKVDYKESSARTLEATHQIFTTPLVADLKITGEKITHIERDAFADYIVDENIVNYISDFKKIALGCAVKKYNADALVGTVFDVVTDQTGHLVITVSGYPATYTNFRNATIDDISLIKEAERTNDSRQNKVVLESPESMLKKENIKLEK